MARPSIRTTRTGKRFGAFDFTEDDERVEKESKKLLGKFGAPGRDASCAVDKYEFLRYFARDTTSDRKELLNSVIDLEEESANEARTLENAQTGKLSDTNGCVVDQQCSRLEFNSMDVSSDGSAHKEGISGLATHLQSTRFDVNNQIVNVISDDECERSGTVSLKEEGTRLGFSGYATINPIDMVSEDYHGRFEMNLSTSTSSLADDEVSFGEEPSDCASGAHEIDAENLQVLIIPDVIIYGDVYCTKSRLTFSCSFIKVEGSAVNATKEAFSCQWPVEDIIKIESEWYLEVETAIVNFLLKSKDSRGAGCADQTSGIDLLKFAVYDPSWSEALEAIKSLDLRYKDVWNNIVAESTENACGTPTSRTLFTNPVDSFEDIIYPRGDPDAVLISKRDIEFLQPESFINDTIIDFYVKYLKNQIQPEEQSRFHFFNCFFFRKLANLDKGSPSSSEGRESFQRIQKWTKKVDLFGKDYIFIPVNYSFHWSLIVICHPGEAVHFNDDEAENSQRVPCILHLDSIKGSHRGLKNLFPSYLSEEWKERHGDKTNYSSKILNLRFIPLELPQQENSFDCGLFLLHYLELFLAQAPANFSPFNITKSDRFNSLRVFKYAFEMASSFSSAVDWSLTRNWFPPAEASAKRGYIRELLYILQESHSLNVRSANCYSSPPSSGVPDKTDQENEIKILKESCSSRKPSGGSSSIAISTQCAVTLPSAACSSLVVRFGESSGELPDLILSKERFCTGSYHREVSMCPRVFMSPIEEVQESCGRATVSPLDIEDSRRMADQVKTSGTTLFSSDDCQLPEETSENDECTLNIEDSDKEDTASITSIPESDGSSEVQLNEEELLLVSAKSEELHRTRKIRSPSTSIKTLSDCVVEDSLEVEVIDKGGDEIKDSASSFVSTVVRHDRKEKEPVLARSRVRVSQLMEKSVAKRPRTCSS